MELVSGLITVLGLLGIAAMLGLFSVIPIDIIVQSKTNNANLASNTIVIFVFLAFIVVSLLLWQLRRITMQARRIASIPSYWVPITASDIGYSTATYITPSRHSKAINLGQ